MAFKIPRLSEVLSPGHQPLLPSLAETRQHTKEERATLPTPCSTETWFWGRAYASPPACLPKA